MDRKTTDGAESAPNESLPNKATDGVTISSTPSHQRSDFLDCTKGSLIFLMVWGHSIQFLGYTPTRLWVENPFWVDPVFKAIYTFHMPLFMAISGYLAFRSVQKASPRIILWGRFQHLIIPTISWGIIFVVVRILIKRSAAIETQSITLFWKSVIEASGALWFLWAVFLSTVAVVCMKAVRLQHTGAYIAAAALALLVPDGVLMPVFKYTFPFFLAGYLWARGNPQKTVPGPILTVVLGLVAVGCYLLWSPTTYVYVSNLSLGLSNAGNIIIEYVAGAVGSLLFLIFMRSLHARYKSGLLQTFGKSSLEIYLIQTYLFRALPKPFLPFKDSRWFAITTAPVAAFIICVACVALARYVTHFSLFTRLLFGRAPNRTASSVDNGRSLSTLRLL